MYLTRARRGFTLIELLVVIAIIAILIGLLLPAVQKVREAAARMTCSNNLKQMALGCHSYESSFGKLPPPRGTNSGGFTAYRGWLCELLPYIEQQALRDQMGNTWPGGFFTAYARPVKTYVCPSDPRNLMAPTGGAGVTSYLGVTGAFSGAAPSPFMSGDGASARDGIFDPGPNNGTNPPPASRGIVLNSIQDGTSNTLMLGERPPDNAMYWGWWSVSDYDCLLAVENTVYLNSPTQSGSNPVCTVPPRYSPGNPQFNCHANHFYSMHTGGGNWAMGDGSIRFVPYSVDLNALRAASTRAGGEVLGLN
jgi:prepilin-type N-terminal cleavage/methylation domain-containing protein